MQATGPSITATYWKLDVRDKAVLLQQLRPVWPDVLGDHVTLAADAVKDAGPPWETFATIIGQADDGRGV